MKKTEFKQYRGEILSRQGIKGRGRVGDTSSNASFNSTDTQIFQNVTTAQKEPRHFNALSDAGVAMIHATALVLDTVAYNIASTQPFRGFHL